MTMPRICEICGDDVDAEGYDAREVDTGTGWVCEFCDSVVDDYFDGNPFQIIDVLVENILSKQ